MLRGASRRPGVWRCIPVFKAPRAWSSSLLRPKFLPIFRHQDAAPQVLAPPLVELLAPLKRGDAPPLAVQPKTWEDLKLHHGLIKRLNELGLAEPTEVQRLGIPPITRRDACVVLRAQTGTGKTLAYLLPILSHMRTLAKPTPFSTLVLAPSRELVAQIFTVIREFEKFPIVSLIGGPSLDEQIRKLKTERPVMILANPKRLHELLEIPEICSLITPRLDFLVLDELDHMVPPMNRYAPRKEVEKRKRHPPPAQLAISAVKRSTPNVQTIVVSATASARVTRSLRYHKWAVDPTVVGSMNTFTPPASVKHFYVRCTQQQKLRAVVRFIRENNPTSVLAILGTNSRIAQFTKLLNVKGISTEALYKIVANATDDTEWAAFLEKFKSGALKVVVTTEEMARGLDFPFINTVLILELPETHGAYLHLAGRTGRVGREGSVFSFVDDEEFPRLERLWRELGTEVSEMKLLEPAETDKVEEAKPDEPVVPPVVLPRPARARK